MWAAIIGVLFLLSPFIIIIIFLIYDGRELRRCYRCGKSGLRKSRPWTSEVIPKWLKNSSKAGDHKVEYTCKYCGYKEWIPDTRYPTF
jgi:hypothetical protein